MIRIIAVRMTEFFFCGVVLNVIVVVIISTFSLYSFLHAFFSVRKNYLFLSQRMI